MYTDVGPNQDPSAYARPDVEDLMTRYADDVLRVCRIYLGKRSLAEDAFQDVFVKVFLKGDSYRGDTPVKYWLLAIARNVCRDYLRSAWLSRVVSYEEWSEKRGALNPVSVRRKLTASGREEERILDSIPDESPLLQAVTELPAKYKDVILLRFLYDLDNSEIARQLGITESAVRTRLFRARKQLSPYMEGEDE